MREEFEKWYKDTQGYSPTFLGDESKPYSDSLEREFYSAFKAGYELALGKINFI